jgi:hypothetical protein
MAVMSTEVLDGARKGDEDAFMRLVEPHRAELHALCYVAGTIEVLTLAGTKVRERKAFMAPELFPRFGLSGEIPGLRRHA